MAILEVQSDDDFSSFGHDKSLAIRPYAALPDIERPVLFYAGDGVSDLSAAKETDLLFAKAGKGIPISSYSLRSLDTDSEPDLVTYCENENVAHTTFQDFSQILATVKDIVSGKTSVHEVAKKKI